MQGIQIQHHGEYDHENFPVLVIKALLKKHHIQYSSSIVIYASDTGNQGGWLALLQYFIANKGLSQ